MEIKASTTIKQLYDEGRLSTRTFNSLYHSGFRNVDQVRSFAVPETKLLNLPMFGKKGYAEVLDILNKLACGQEEESRFEPELIDSVGETLATKLQNINEETVGEENKGTRLFKGVFPNAASIHQLVCGDNRELLKLYKEGDYVENRAVRKLLLKFLENTLHAMEQKLIASEEVREMYQAKCSFLSLHVNHTYTEKVTYFLSELAKTHLTNFINEKKKVLKLSLRRYLDMNASTIDGLAHLMDADAKEVQRLYRKRGTHHTITQLIRFIDLVKEQLDMCLVLDEMGTRELLIQDWYSQLRKADHLFIVEHYNQYGYYPIFFLIYTYLHASNLKRDMVYSRVNGLVDGKFWELNEVAGLLDICRVRVRQLEMAGPSVVESELFKQMDRTVYKELLDLPYIKAKSREWMDLASREHVPTDIHGLYPIIKLLGGKDLQIELTGNGEITRRRFKYQYEVLSIDKAEVIINRAQMPHFNFQRCIASLLACVEKKQRKDTYVCLGDFVEDLPQSEQIQAMEVLRYVSQTGMGLEVDNKGLVTIQKNTLNVVDEIHAILEKEGHPMTLEEMFVQFKASHPNHRITKCNQIRPYIWGNEDIRMIGKSGHYGLERWGDRPFDSIREMLYKCLKRSDDPVPVSMLFEDVSKIYPYASKSSLRTTMDMDPQNRFVRFKGDYYGLKDKEHGLSLSVQEKKDKSKVFSIWYRDFTNFVAKNHRLPIDRKDMDEYRLHVWMLYVQNGLVNITEKQRQLYLQTMAEYERLRVPRKLCEYNFKENCERYRAFVDTYAALPTISTNYDLHTWIMRSIKNFHTFTDYRKEYLSDLLRYLDSKGLSVTG